MKAIRFFTTIWILSLLISCESLGNRKDQEPEAIARVGSEYLYLNDIKDLVPENTEPQDSILMVRNFIDRWATQKLLIQTAELNLSPTQKSDFDKLVNQYKIDLYTKAYLEELVKTRIDTMILDNEVVAYYEKNKENFKTSSLLAKLRFIKVPKNHQKLTAIKERFFNPKKSDKTFWDTYLVQLKGAALNDSVWVDANQIYQKVSFINSENIGQYLQAGKKYEYADGEDLYFIKVNSVIPKNEISPFSYIKPTLKQIILNNRKLEFIKKIEKEITDDALKNNKYEILR